MRVAIIGAGLAGCALAYVLKRAGAEPIVYEAGAEIAPGASGNPIGLYNPRFTAEFGPDAEFYSVAFQKTLGVFSELEDIDWHVSGALHLINDEKKEKRFAQTVESWPSPEMRIVDAHEASEIAGVDVSYSALYLKDSGSVSPNKLCVSYVRDVEVKLNCHSERSEESHEILRLSPQDDSRDYDVVILSCGMSALEFLPQLPLKAVRGQVTMVKANEASAKLKTALCYGGYVSAAVNGVHMVGSTFQRWLDHTDLLAEDDADNLAKLAAHIPALSGLEVIGARAALRTTSADHFPIVGHVDENLYVSTAHGSHGILSSLMAAEILSAAILGQKSPVSEDVLKRLAPDRF